MSPFCGGKNPWHCSLCELHCRWSLPLFFSNFTNKTYCFAAKKLSRYTDFRAALQIAGIIQVFTKTQRETASYWRMLFLPLNLRIKSRFLDSVLAKCINEPHSFNYAGAGSQAIIVCILHKQKRHCVNIPLELIHRQYQVALAQRNYQMKLFTSPSFWLFTYAGHFKQDPVYTGFTIPLSQLLIAQLAE